MRRVIILLLALLIMISIFVVAQYDAIIEDGYAAGVNAPKKTKHVGNDCPDSHITYKAVQKETGFTSCKKRENKGWEFVQPLEECGCDYDPPEDKDPTNTPRPVVVVPSNTPALRVLPTNTPQSKDPVVPPTATNSSPPDDRVEPTATPGSNDDPPSDKKPTHTATYIVPFSAQPTATKPCDMCGLVSTMASAQSTIAAGVEQMIKDKP